MATLMQYNSFTGGCSLVSGKTEISGTLVDLAELQLPCNKEQLHKQLPGLSLRVDNITSTYALITSHSALPGSSCLREWKFSEKFLGHQVAEKILDEFVSGVVSCCGSKSFVIPSETVAYEHHRKNCSLGLNFTMLFLNEEFQRHYRAHLGVNAKPPAMTFSQCEADINWVDQCISPARNNAPEDHQMPRGAYRADQPLVVINASSRSKVTIESARDQREQFHPDLQLCQEITRFNRVKSVRYKSNESSANPQFDEGMPLMYQSGSDIGSLRVIGVLSGHGKVLILSALLQLLKGSPAPCLSLLLYTDMRRLWIDKWSHLIIPHLECLQRRQPEQILQMLSMLFRTNNSEQRCLSIIPTDPVETRLGFLKLVQALFFHFRDLSKSIITLKTKRISDLINCDLVGEIRVLCQSLITLCKDSGEYKESDMENDSVKQLHIHCVKCAIAILEYQHEQEVVEEELFKDNDAFETLLSRLQSLCSYPFNDFYRKRHTYCNSKSVLGRENDELRKENNMLKMEIQKLEQQQRQGAPVRRRSTSGPAQIDMPTGERSIPARTVPTAPEDESNESPVVHVVYNTANIGPYM